MIAETSDTLTIVLYENHRGAKCFEVKKKTFKVLIYGTFAFLLVCLLTTLTLLVSFKKLSLDVKSQTPIQVKKLEGENLNLKSELMGIQLEKDELAQRLKEPAPSTEKLLEQNPFLVFNPIQGSKNLTHTTDLAVENFQWQGGDAPGIDNIFKASINFNLVNTKSNETPVQGYLFVALRGANFIQIYPRAPKTLKNALTSFQLGEKFYISRFKPVEINFSQVRGQDFDQEVYVNLVVYSRMGDFLLNKIYGPYQIK